MPIESIGFPQMHKEIEEQRDFLPSLFGKIGRMSDVALFLEKGYGKKMGFTEEDYLSENPHIQFCNAMEAVLDKDLVIVVRAPDNKVLEQMKSGGALFTMLHYDTHKKRNELLEKKNLFCYSMDSIMDDDGKRLIVFYEGTSYAAIHVAFTELSKRRLDWKSKGRQPLNISMIGCGSVAQAAAKALEYVSDRAFLAERLPGVIISMLPRTVTQDEKVMQEILSKTDVLVDASRRIDSSHIIIPNELLGYLPSNAIIVDITADPYDFSTDPPSVKGIEGLPEGSLRKFVIDVDDPLYESIPENVTKDHRRLYVGCNAWPSFYSEKCMLRYERQILPFLRLLLTKGPESLNDNSDDEYERALYRSTLKWHKSKSSLPVEG